MTIIRVGVDAAESMREVSIEDDQSEVSFFDIERWFSFSDLSAMECSGSGLPR